jgi:hypothetical protein
MCKDIQEGQINNKYIYKHSALHNERQECRWLSYKTTHHRGDMEFHKENTYFIY